MLATSLLSAYLNMHFEDAAFYKEQLQHKTRCEMFFCLISNVKWQQKALYEQKEKVSE